MCKGRVGERERKEGGVEEGGGLALRSVSGLKAFLKPARVPFVCWYDQGDWRKWRSTRVFLSTSVLPLLLLSRRLGQGYLFLSTLLCSRPFTMKGTGVSLTAEHIHSEKTLSCLCFFFPKKNVHFLMFLHHSATMRCLSFTAILTPPPPISSPSPHLSCSSHLGRLVLCNLCIYVHDCHLRPSFVISVLYGFTERCS